MPLCISEWNTCKKTNFVKINDLAFSKKSFECLSSDFDIHYFYKKGFPVYLGSSINPSEFNLIYEFNYFGKVNLGRLKSLSLLGDALYKIDKSFCLSVYSQNVSKKESYILKKHHCSKFQHLRL